MVQILKMKSEETLKSQRLSMKLTAQQRDAAVKQQKEEMRVSAKFENETNAIV